MKWVLLFFLLTPAQLFAQTKADDVKTFTLKNGLKFLVLEDHSIPDANMYLFYKVGSRNEHPGITGLSHFFEHMMFNGAKKYGPKLFDQVMEFNGGSNNAYTTNDVTVYTDWFPPSSLEVIFEVMGRQFSNSSTLQAAAVVCKPKIHFNCTYVFYTFERKLENMDTKLTLKLEQNVIEKAKNYAKARKTSLSKLIENYLHKITNDNETTEKITPLVKSLSGIIDLPNDFNHKKSGYADYLIDKYK